MHPAASAPPTEADIRAIIARHLALEGPLLPILHALQEEWGHVPAAAHAPIVDALNISKAELHGVISFYHDFRERPAGRHVVKICRAEACQAMGADRLLAHIKQRLGAGLHETTADGSVTVEPVYCLGNCASSPAVMLDGEPCGRVTPERFDALLAERCR